MTRITHVGAVNMAAIFTTGGCTVVAGEAVTGERAVIRNRGRCPGISAMTVVTLQRSWNMARRFAFGD